MYRNFQNISSDSERLIDQVKSIEAVESDLDVLLPGLPGGGVDLELLLLPAGREDAVPGCPGAQLEGPPVPRTAETETPVGEDLDVRQVEWASGVGTPAGGG